MNLKNVSDRDLTWHVAIHLVFVVSGVILALTDRISEGGHKAERGRARGDSARAASERTAIISRPAPCGTRAAAAPWSSGGRGGPGLGCSIFGVNHCVELGAAAVAGRRRVLVGAPASPAGQASRMWKW